MESAETLEQLCEQALAISRKIAAKAQQARELKGIRPLSAVEVQGWLLTRREREGLSLREVAKITGVSASTLSRIENGVSFDWETGQALIRWLCEESDVTQ